jgi:hypothetical protein
MTRMVRAIRVIRAICGSIIWYSSRHHEIQFGSA